MRIKKNSDFEYISVDDENMAVFDPATGDTILIEGAGVDILALLENSDDTDDIFSQLTVMYDAQAKDIQNEVSAFLNELLDMKVLIKI